MHISDELVKEQRHYEELNSAVQTALALMDADIATAKNGNAYNKAETIENLRTKRKGYEAGTSEMIAKSAAKITIMQGTIKANEAAVFASAQNVLLAQKEQAAQVWHSNGGDAESFESAWPAMQNKLLSDKVMSAMSTTAKPTSIPPPKVIVKLNTTEKPTDSVRLPRI